MTNKEKRIRAIAQQITKSHGVCKRQARQIAREDVEAWYRTFSPENIRATAQRNATT